MSKREMRWLLSKLLPRVYGRKQRLALFTALLMLAMAGIETRIECDFPHLHVDPEPIVPTLTVSWAASGNATARTLTYEGLGT